ncbi:serine/threonine-protein kinase BRSK1-like isoform X4 [Bolinopsis microptera]|uniref:serine/threonine-protein kinase BRSK1-like isoform X4 n=1 Tax=Bolinopsis microptera TaxID=2820187 RepID=UPI00307AC5BA
MVIANNLRESNDVHEKRDIELRILSAARAGDFALERVLGNGDNGVVVSAKCTRRGLPFSNKLYAVKILFNDNALRTRDIRDAFENEWEILSRIRTHPHIIRYWSQFVDVVPEVIARQCKHPTPNMQSQFVIMDFHHNNFGGKRATLPTPLPVNTGMKYCVQLADGLVFLKSQGVLHLDLKPDNILLSDTDNIIICDFGCALQFDTESMRKTLMRGEPPGGNPAHLSPEVLNEFFRAQRGGPSAEAATVSYFRQTEWAYACMVHEMIRNVHPFPEYPVRYGRPIQYYDRQIPSLPTSYPQEFQFIVRQLLSYEPTTRPSIKEAFNILTSCHQGEEYNVQELQNKISMLTDRCQSAERERKEARRERDETVKQLQELIAELKTMRGEREQVNTSLARLKRENDLANKNVSQLRLEQERDRRELTALRRERDVAQTMINQLRASRDSPTLFVGNQSAVVNKWTSKEGGAGPPDKPGLGKSNTAVPGRRGEPEQSATTPRKNKTAAGGTGGQESGYVSANFGVVSPSTPNTGGRSRRRWGKAQVPGNLSSNAGTADEELPSDSIFQQPPSPKLKRDALFPNVGEGPPQPPLSGGSGSGLPPTTPRRSSNAIVKCRRCSEQYKESENHVGACRWHPGKVTVIDWGWMKVKAWDCCGATHDLSRQSSQGARITAGCKFTIHTAVITPGCKVPDDEENDDENDKDSLNRKISPSYIEIGVDKSLDKKKPFLRKRSGDKTNLNFKTEAKPRRKVNLAKIDEGKSQGNLKTAPERDNISVSTFIIEHEKANSSLFSKTCSVM